MASTTPSSSVQDGRPTTPVSSSPPEFDLVVIGFGPAQLATAIAQEESKRRSNVLYLEKKPAFSWYPSSQVPRTRMENPFAFDLVAPRNPRSKFSYVNFLQSKDRLVEFANSDRLNPLRVEFEEYLGWCAEQLKDKVRYDNEVLSVFPEKVDSSIRGWNVGIKTGHGERYMVRAKNIVVPAPPTEAAKKPKPLLSVDFETGQRIISTDEYLARRDELRVLQEPRLNISLVGSSEKAIEVLEDLLCCHKLGNITMITDNDSLCPVKMLNESKTPPAPKLCSIWARPSTESTSSIAGASERIQHIYSRAYDKQVASKGKYSLKLVGKDAEPSSDSNFIIVDKPGEQAPVSNLLQGIDSLVLGCCQKGDSLEEVQFKRGAVADGCRLWMMSARSEGGRSMARDVAVRAGEVVRAVALGVAKEGRNGGLVVNARM